MVEHIKVPASNVWGPELNPWSPLKGERSDLILQSCPLTSTCVLV